MLNAATVNWRFPYAILSEKVSQKQMHQIECLTELKTHCVPSQIISSYVEYAGHKYVAEFAILMPSQSVRVSKNISTPYQNHDKKPSKN